LKAFEWQIFALPQNVFFKLAPGEEEFELEGGGHGLV
jgi:hypothetical protein